MMWDLSVVHEWFSSFLALCDMNLKKMKKFKKLLWFMANIVFHMCICLLVVHVAISKLPFKWWFSSSLIIASP